jgi:hypothetical protein
VQEYGGDNMFGKDWNYCISCGRKVKEILLDITNPATDDTFKVCSKCYLAYRKEFKVREQKEQRSLPDVPAPPTLIPCISCGDKLRKGTGDVYYEYMPGDISKVKDGPFCYPCFEKYIDKIQQPSMMSSWSVMDNPMYASSSMAGTFVSPSTVVMPDTRSAGTEIPVENVSTVYKNLEDKQEKLRRDLEF